MSTAQMTTGRARLRAATESLLCLVAGFPLFAVGFGVLLSEHNDNPPAGALALIGVDALLGVIGCVAIGPMRRAGAWHLLYVPLYTLSSWALPASLIALVRLGALRSRTVHIAAAAMAFASGVLYVWLTARAEGAWSASWAAEILAALVIAVVFLLWGQVRGTRAALLTSLREQAVSAERERQAVQRQHDSAVALAREGERLAIARDMHDSLSHQLSLISMHAGALAYRDDLPPAKVRQAARTLRDAAATANAELREVLSALRDCADAEPLPTGATVVAVVERARGGGQHVNLVWDGLTAADLDGASRATTVALERITSELVTNAHKHAPGAELGLRLSREPGAVRLTARNPMRSGIAPLGTGFGLIGLRERARLLGGDVEIDSTAGVFEVEVVIPWKR